MPYLSSGAIGCYELFDMNGAGEAANLFGTAGYEATQSTLIDQARSMLGDFITSRGGTYWPTTGTACP